MPASRFGLAEQGVPDRAADALGVGVVVVAITYLSLIVGELVPKQIALRDAEKVAARVAPAMVFLSKIGAPVVWLLDKSGRIVLALLGHSGESNASVTDDEIRTVSGRSPQRWRDRNRGIGDDHQRHAPGRPQRTRP